MQIFLETALGEGWSCDINKLLYVYLLEPAVQSATNAGYSQK